MDDHRLKNSFPSPTPSQQEVNDFVAAAGKGDKARVTEFIGKYGIFLDIRDDSGNTALTWAVTQRQKETVELLLSGGASLAATDKSGWTPLTHAAWHGQNEMLDFLVEKGAVVDARDNGGMTPLMRAACQGRTDTVQLLLEKGASVEEIDFNGRSALTIAKRGYPQTAELIQQWPQLQRQREERKRELAKQQAEERAEIENKAQAAARLEKLKNRRPPQSPFKK